MSLLSILFSASLPVLVIAAVLFAMSIYSWGLAAYRFKIVNSENNKLRSLSGRMADLVGLEDYSHLKLESFNAGIKFQAFIDHINNSYDRIDTERNYVGKVSFTQKGHLTNYKNYLGKGLNHLAIISSVAPYIGLLGTVIGILDVFHNIGSVEVVTLSVVAPPIAEALIVTAVGLFVAIPANILHTLLTDKATLTYEMLEKSLEAIVAFKVGGGR